MRNLGIFLFLVGVSGFIYCSFQISNAGPIPPGLNIMETLEYPAGRLELGRYLAAIVGAVGVLIALLPGER